MLNSNSYKQSSQKDKGIENQEQLLDHYKTVFEAI